MSVPEVIPGVIVAISSATTTTLVSGKPGMKIRVWQFDLENKHAATATDITLKSGTTAISGVITLNANGGAYGRNASGVAYFTTLPGDDLNLTTSAAGNIVGQVQYTYSE